MAFMNLMMTGDISGGAGAGAAMPGMPGAGAGAGAMPGMPGAGAGAGAGRPAGG